MAQMRECKVTGTKELEDGGLLVREKGGIDRSWKVARVGEEGRQGQVVSGWGGGRTVTPGAAGWWWGVDMGESGRRNGLRAQAAKAQKQNRDASGWEEWR